MAISFVGSGGVANGTTPTVNVPTGYSVGDLLLLVTSGIVTPATPTGWTALATQGAGQFITVFYKFAVASESSVTLSASTSSRAVMLAYSGVSLNDAIGTFATGTSTSASTNSLTTRFNNDYVISVFATASGASTWTAPASTTSRLSSNSTAALTGLLIVDESQATAGATTARTATISTSKAWSTLGISIRTPQNLYWVGGTAGWTATATTPWSATSGGAGSASVPTYQDNAYFDANSGVGTATISTGATCNDLVMTGFTGTLSSTAVFNIYGSVTLASGMTISGSTDWNFLGTGSKTLTSNGKTVDSPIIINNSGLTLTLSDALISSSAVKIQQGTFSTGNYNLTANLLFSDTTNTRTIGLGSSTVTLSATGSGNLSPFYIADATNLTFNAGTSTIALSATTGTPTLNSPGLTFYNVSFTGGNAPTNNVNGANTFNNLSFANATATSSIRDVIFNADQTINGTLTLNGATNSWLRNFFRSGNIGTQRTLTCAAIASPTNVDFRDIAITGTAAPLTGTRIGDCKGNSGITFDAAKTVYYRGTGSANWGSNNWSNTSGGTADIAYFPLAQDTVIFPAATYPASGSTITVDKVYNIGTIDMSLRTTNTMTIAFSNNAFIHGNWINGTGLTLTASTIGLNFVGRNTQDITSAGKSIPYGVVIESPSGTVRLQDAITISRNSNTALQVRNGGIDANGYNLTLSGALSGFSVNTNNPTTAAIGSGTWTIAGTGGWNPTTGANLTVTGTGTISLTSASAKPFNGRDIQTYPTINQGGAGALTISGSNKFANITNTYSATGATSVLFTSGTTNEFTAFNLTGASGNVCTLGATTTSQATLKKSSGWYMGANSTDGGNNTGLTFTAGGGIDYLSVSYINGQLVSTGNNNFFLMFA